jgi:hypothetical protein
VLIRIRIQIKIPEKKEVRDGSSRTRAFVG